MANVVSSPSLVQDVEKKIGVFLTAHHVVLYLALFAALFAGVYLFEDARIKVAQGKADKADAVALQAKQDAQTSEQKNAAFQIALTAQMKSLQEANAQQQAANAQMALALTAATNALAAQRKVDATLPPTAIAGRWQTLVPNASVAVTPTGYAVDGVSGLATVQALEELPVNRAKIVTLTSMLAGDDKTVLNDAAILEDEKKSHAADLANDAIQLDASKKQTVAVQADFTLYKKKARRNILRAFVVGFVSGFALRHVTF